MKKVELLNLKGEKVKDINLNEEIFGITPNNNVLNDAIILSMASLRQGTHKTKNRSEVSGGGRKPWRQKGTGRARQGSIRAVQWVGGGRYGIKSALSEKVNAKELIVVENIKLSAPKTTEMLKLLETLKVADKKVLLVVKEFDDNLILATRNIQNLVLILADEVNVLDVVGTDVMVITEDALKYVEEVLK